MPILVLLAPIIACYMDIARPKLPVFHHRPPVIYVIDFRGQSPIEPGPFGGLQ